MSLATPEKIRKLQRALYVKAVATGANASGGSENGSSVNFDPTNVGYRPCRPLTRRDPARCTLVRPNDVATSQKLEELSQRSRITLAAGHSSRARS